MDERSYFMNSVLRPAVLPFTKQTNQPAVHVNCKKPDEQVRLPFKLAKPPSSCSPTVNWTRNIKRRERLNWKFWKRNVNNQNKKVTKTKLSEKQTFNNTFTYVVFNMMRDKMLKGIYLISWRDKPWRKRPDVNLGFLSSSWFVAIDGLLGIAQLRQW